MQETEQEIFWRGEFGDTYLERNTLENVPATTRKWLAILKETRGKVRSVLELGCNIGINLHALRELIPQVVLEGVEINAKAAAQARAWGCATVHQESLLHFIPARQYDLAFTAGVLIHIAPEALPIAYDVLYKASARFICVAEYYNPTPVEVPYREHSGKLFKRDFAGEIMDRHPDVTLLDYGFFYRRDPLLKEDDITWFLMEKCASRSRTVQGGAD